jgi:hypothetical protein
MEGDGIAHALESYIACLQPGAWIRFIWAGLGRKPKIDIHGTLSASFVVPPCIFS